MNAIKDRQLTASQEQLIRNELKPDELPLLLGTIKGEAFSSLFFFLFASLWLAISVPFFIHSLGALPETTGEGVHIWLKLIFSADILFSLVFVLVGFGILFVPFFLVRKFRNTVVAFTDRRLIVSSPKDMESVPLDNIKLFRIVEEPGRIGTFGVDTESPLFENVLKFSSSSCPVFMLGDFPDIASVERLVRSYCLPPDKVVRLPFEPSLDRESLSAGTLDRIGSLKDDDEQVLLVEKPAVPSLAFLLLVRAAFCLFFGGIASAVIVANAPSWLAPLLLALVGVVVLGVLLSAWYVARKWRNITYVLTNKRAVVVKQRLSGKTEVTSYPANRMIVRGQKIRRKGGGDIVFDERIYRSKDGNQVVKEGFMRLPDLGRVKKLVEAVIDSYHKG